MRFFVLTLLVLLLQYVLGKYLKSISLCCWEDIVSMSIISLLILSKFNINISILSIFSIYLLYIWVMSKYTKINENTKIVQISIKKRSDLTNKGLLFNGLVFYGLLLILFK